MTDTPENENLSALSSLLESAGLTAKDFMQTLSVLGNAKKENIEESLEKFLQKTRVEYRRGRLLTFKGWVGLVKELLDELD